MVAHERRGVVRGRNDLAREKLRVEQERRGLVHGRREGGRAKIRVAHGPHTVERGLRGVVHERREAARQRLESGGAPKEGGRDLLEAQPSPRDPRWHQPGRQKKLVRRVDLADARSSP